jgi:hypothetical protein
MSRNDLSRRSLIADGASLPVAAGAITVPAIAVPSGNPDAELLALRVQLSMQSSGNTSTSKRATMYLGRLGRRGAKPPDCLNQVQKCVFRQMARL